MTDFGRRPLADAATGTKQDEIKAAIDLYRATFTATIGSFRDSTLNKLGTLEDDVELLTAQATQTLVDGITFDDDPYSYIADLIDVSAYRDFLLLVTLTVYNSPTDIVIRVLFSDQATGDNRYQNGPFGDLRYVGTAGIKAEAIHGKCLAPYMGLYVLATGTDATNSFTLTVKAVLTR